MRNIGLNIANEGADIAIDDMRVEVLDREGQRAATKQPEGQITKHAERQQRGAYAKQKVSHHYFPPSDGKTMRRFHSNINQPCAPNSLAIAVDIRRHSA